jgi:hypothetical protein
VRFCVSKWHSAFNSGVVRMELRKALRAPQKHLLEAYGSVAIPSKLLAPIPALHWLCNRNVSIIVGTEGIVIVARGQSYRCINPDCRCEIEVIEPPAEAVFNPRCCCGAEMKKPYTKPAVRSPDAQPEVFDTQKARK